MSAPFAFRKKTPKKRYNITSADPVHSTDATPDDHEKNLTRILPLNRRYTFPPWSLHDLSDLKKNQTKPIPQKHKAAEQESQKVPSRPPPRKPTDTPGPPPRAQRTVEKKRKEPKPVALPEIDALPKRGTTTSAQNLVLDIMVAHPPVAIAAFLKPHCKYLLLEVMEVYHLYSFCCSTRDCRPSL